MHQKSKFQDARKVAEKYFRKFSNFTKHQKAFVLFLLVFALTLLLFPIVNLTEITEQAKASSLWIWNFSYLKSFIVAGLALGFLFGWNMNMNFKAFVVKFFGFRETEPVLNFIFLRVIASVYMGILDTLGVVATKTQSVSVARGLRVQLFVLVLGLGISIVDVRKSANQNSQKTKILNIVDDEAPKMQENKRFVQHLFDEEELD